MADVFISYKRESQVTVQSLVDGLRREGLSVFWDPNVPAGAPWEEHIERELEAAKVVVVAWSQAAVLSEFVRAEARSGLRRNILLQVSLERCEPPLFFGERQSVDLSIWNGAPATSPFPEILAEVRSILSGRGPGLAAGIDPVRPSVAQIWSQTRGSTDEQDYADFVEVFATSPETFLARKHLRQLQRWGQVSKRDLEAVRGFLDTQPFEALRDEASRVLEQLEAEALRRIREREAQERIATEERERIASLRLKEEARERERQEATILENERLSTAARLARLEKEATWRLPGTTFRDRVGLPWMVTLPRPQPPQESGLDPTILAISRDLVSEQQWAECVRERGQEMSQQSHDTWRNRRGYSAPITSVNWYDAELFCKWLSGRTGAPYRLLSDAEWMQCFGPDANRLLPKLRAPKKLHIAKNSPRHGMFREWLADSVGDKRLVRSVREYNPSAASPLSRHSSLSFRIARDFEC